MLFSFLIAKGGASACSFRRASGGRTTVSPRLSLDRRQGSSGGERGALTCNYKSPNGLSGSLGSVAAKPPKWWIRRYVDMDTLGSIHRGTSENAGFFFPCGPRLCARFFCALLSSECVYSAQAAYVGYATYRARRNVSAHSTSRQTDVRHLALSNACTRACLRLSPRVHRYGGPRGYTSLATAAFVGGTAHSARRQVPRLRACSRTLSRRASSAALAPASGSNPGTMGRGGRAPRQPVRAGVPRRGDGRGKQLRSPKVSERGRGAVGVGSPRVRTIHPLLIPRGRHTAMPCYMLCHAMSYCVDGMSIALNTLGHGGGAWPRCCCSTANVCTYVRAQEASHLAYPLGLTRRGRVDQRGAAPRIHPKAGARVTAPRVRGLTNRHPN